MKGKFYYILIAGAAATAVFLSALSVSAGQKRSPRAYAITITNLTKGQIFSPPVVISHKDDFMLYTPGEPASVELYSLAEDASTQPLIDRLQSSPLVMDYAEGAEPILPGRSATLRVKARGAFRNITFASMLVTTNDAFTAVQGVKVSPGRQKMLYALAYDAGSEVNSENCDAIPGPPCGNPGVRDPEPDGFVHIHSGIHGIGSLPPDEFDWRNPTAKIEIRPIIDFSY
jgi:hypothetical protein